MALLVCAVWDTEANERTKTSKVFFESLAETVDWSRHRLVVSDNGSCEATRNLYDSIVAKIPNSRVLYNGANLGTAKAVNKGWELRHVGEHVGKLDNDVKFHSSNWADRLEEIVETDPKIGIAALKRNDCLENPWASEKCWTKSEIRMLPHKEGSGQRWYVVEKVQHTMGTAWLVNSDLVDKAGFLFQPSLYGFDDPDYCARAHALGFETVFVPNLPIDHIDDGKGGGGSYQDWKHRVSGEVWQLANAHCGAYKLGLLSPYHGPDDTRASLTDKGKDFYAPLVSAGHSDVNSLLMQTGFTKQGDEEVAYLSPWPKENL